MDLLPAPTSVQGELSHQIVPIDASQVMSKAYTGGVILVDASGGDVTLTLPSTSQCGSNSIYILLVNAGGNDLILQRQDGDTITADGYATYTASVNNDMVLLQSNSSEDYWDVISSAGTWTGTAPTTTTTAPATTTTTP